MNYLLIGINIILTIIIISNLYNRLTLKEGLPGCPSSIADQIANNRRGASRGEINSTIRDIKAQINQVKKEQQGILKKITRNDMRLREVSKQAELKAERNKAKMEKLK